MKTNPPVHCVHEVFIYNHLIYHFLVHSLHALVIQMLIQMLMFWECHLLRQCSRHQSSLPHFPSKAHSLSLCSLVSRHLCLEAFLTININVTSHNSIYPDQVTSQPPLLHWIGCRGVGQALYALDNEGNQSMLHPHHHIHVATFRDLWTCTHGFCTSICLWALPFMIYTQPIFDLIKYHHSTLIRITFHLIMTCSPT